MTLNHTKGYLLALLLSFSSCMLKEDAELIVVSADQQTYVEAYLTAGQPIQASIVESNALDETMSIRQVWNADAQVVFQDSTVRLLNLFYRDSQSGRMMNYANAYLVRPQRDSIYFEAVTPSGLRLSAATEIIEPVKITEGKLDNGIITIACKNTENISHRFYSLHLQVYHDGRSSKSTDYFDYSSIAKEQVVLQRKLDKEADSVLVITYRLNDLNYRFQTNLKQARAANSDPYTSPVHLPGNIKGGAGIFTYYTSDSLMVK